MTHGAPVGKSVEAVKKATREGDRVPRYRGYMPWPACPRCGDLCDPRAFRCPSCGCRLYLD